MGFVHELVFFPEKRGDVAMSCAVGNEGARDGPKHSAAFILRAAIAAIVPAAGPCRIVPPLPPHPGPAALSETPAPACRRTAAAPPSRAGLQGAPPVVAARRGRVAGVRGETAGRGNSSGMTWPCVPCVRRDPLRISGDMQSVHYDKRGAKITIAYEGDDCGGKKDDIEQAANKICADNTAMASVRLYVREHGAHGVPTTG